MIQQASECFDALEHQFDYLIFDGSAEDTAKTRRAFRQADQVIFVANAGDSRDPSAVERALADEAQTTVVGACCRGCRARRTTTLAWTARCRTSVPGTQWV